jgi:peptidoglycan hydrolase-like protein with peptidoglycan-binding domain
VSSISRKTVAWGSGAVLAVAGAAAAIVIAAQDSGQAAAAASASSGRPTAVAAPPPRVVSVSPGAGARHVDGAATVTVAYSGTLSAAAALPVLSPAIAGSWRRAGDTAVFTPDAGFPQDTTVKVTAAQPSGAAPVSASFTTGGYHVLRLQQILAQLGYLPLTWTPAASAGVNTAAAQLAAAYTPPPGTFSWKPGYPAQLRAFWSPGTSNTLDRGAITAFEADHGLTTDGSAGPAVWRALLTAAVKDQRDRHGYSYAVASKSTPESLTIWHDGSQVFSTAANTGIPAAPTADGTFPVYEKLPFQVMTGANPDGSRYSDPVWWISYFNGGDAVHYFDRPSYGYPQSLGCVELPYDAAKEAYSYLPYGTLVTVTG